MSVPTPAGDFSTLFEFLPIGAYRSSPQGRQLRANPALARLNGFADEAEQLASVCDIARDWYVLPTRRDEFKLALERDGRVVGFESEVYRYKTRERIWINENAHVVRGAQGAVRYYEGTVEEITERVRDREALRASQEELRQIMELVPGMVYRVELLPEGERRATYVSSGSRALFGVEPEDIMRDGLLLHRLRHPEDRERIQREGRAANEARLPLQLEYRALLPNGEVKWLHMLSAPAPDLDGREVRVGLVFDITEVKHAQTLRLERDRAEAADLAKSEFLSRVSHELRTPLNAILGFAQLMEMDPGHGPFSERQHGWTRQVLASGRHLLALMDDILDLSSLQTGQIPFSTGAVSLLPLMEEACAMLAGTAQAADVGILIALPAGSPLAVRADRRRLLQVLSNLVSNAIKYNRRGGWVRLDAQPAATEVGLSIADSGPGLDAAQRARLFQPFERLGAQRGPVAGTGLGLALSRQLVEAMGGRIAVDSEPGEGAVFRVWLPVA